MSVRRFCHLLRDIFYTAIDFLRIASMYGTCYDLTYPNLDL